MKISVLKLRRIWNLKGNRSYYGDDDVSPG